MIYFIVYMLIGLGFGSFNIGQSRSELMELYQFLGIENVIVISLILVLSLIFIGLSWPFWVAVSIYLHYCR